MTSLGLGLTMLLHQKFRTLLSVLGVLVAALLIFLQLGLIGSLYLTATQFYDSFDFDMVVVSRGYFHFNAPGTFPEHRLDLARGDRDVASVMPLGLSTVCWHTPEEKNPRRRYILVVGVEPGDLSKLFQTSGPRVFGADVAGRPSVLWAGEQLARRSHVLMDRGSRAEYGRVPANTSPASGFHVEVTTLTSPITSQPDEMYLAGGFEIGTGFAANAVLLAGLDTVRALNRSPGGTVNLGFIRLRPGADGAVVRARLQAHLPSDVLLLTPAEIRAHESRHWTQNLPIGKFFAVGVAVALFVGVLFVYQMMAGDVRKHEAQYATLKALGYQNAYLGKVVLWQGLILGLVGFGLSVLVAHGLFVIVQAWARVPLVLANWLLFWTFVPTMFMCVVSGLLAVLKVYQMDPADRF